jgi:hypothetical protein
MRSTRSRFRAGTAAAAGCAVVALAACGGGDGGDAAASDQEKFEQAALAHARCMREHGVDVPDPKPGQGGIVVVGPGPGPNGGGPPPRAMREAEEACEKHLRDIPPPKISEEQKREMRDAALAHARCMREHGIDFPDPKFSADGGITVEARGLDPDSPKMREANEACAKHLPKLGEGAEPDAGP